MKPTKDTSPSTMSKPSGSKSLIYNPAFRSAIFQIIAIAALVFFFYTIINNALNNLDARGIATGFGFLNQEAGFGIGLTLIEYNETYSYGRTFIVGLLNTALVSVLGIILATAIGFTMGVARLSTNWLVSRLAAVYIETFRNIPLLLQIFFWYFAVLQALPSARQSLSLGEAIFLNVRGLYFPAPVFNEGSGVVIAAFVIGLIATISISIWARNKQRLTGQQTPMGRIGLGLLVGLPLLVYFVSGMPISLEYPQLKGFNFKGGISIIPELAALLLALSVYTAAFYCGNRTLRYQRGESWSNRGRDVTWFTSC